jgi:hypothetical protein
MKQNDSANNTPEKELLGIMNRLIYIILFMLVVIIVLPLLVFYRDDIEQFFIKKTDTDSNTVVSTSMMPDRSN